MVKATPTDRNRRGPPGKVAVASADPCAAAPDGGAGAKPRQPKYAAIRDWLAQRIASGEFSCGEQLPSEHDLMTRFDVSRVTARQALDDLRQRGVVESRRGKGYFVQRMKVLQSLERLQSFGEMMAPLGLETHSKVIELLEVPATKEVAEALRIEPGTVVTRLARQRIAGGSALSLDISFFPLDIGRRLMVLDLSHEDVFHLLERQLGVELGYADLTIDVVAAEARHAPHLGAEVGAQVMRIRRLTVDDNGRPVDYERLYSRLDAVVLQLRVPRW